MVEYHSENFGKSLEYRSKPHENWIVPPHMHEFSEIVYVYKGILSVIIDGKKFVVPENHLIFIMPNSVHEYLDETKSSIQCAVFSNDFIPIFFKKVGNFDIENPVYDFSDQKWLLDELALVKWESKFKVCALLNLVCDKILSSSKLIESDKKEQSVYRSAIGIISENFRENLTLKKVAKKLGYHEKYLSSALHSLTKMNFREFLASYRINYAKGLMKDNKKLKISEIALESGFSSINTFNRAFKNLTGKTPSEFLKEKE